MARVNGQIIMVAWAADVILRDLVAVMFALENQFRCVAFCRGA